ncbi:MAG TPA: preprotein translocase subunit YajC [Candidatus Hydrogenedentes bacterium]|nr:preprotein translocase subunit YajC [Candidatus Hydrogenedentota bacterium]HPC18194.1 preprotein translocase subunit YajC [Candidatus Hydrogenedentota bacterium]HRT21775.1 preprotein translocase subunit YajC [Candidatus Hydrogenedentota bacterium]HRT66605.1 preprotein translocase subunit YajC [Candidatus Hydrogenedentota bacterium]
MWNSAVLAQVLAQANDAGDAPAATGNPMNSMIFMLVAFMAIMYFLTIRPNQKREKERKEMLASLAKGDKVITQGGICGYVVGLSEKTVVLRVSDEPNVKMEFLRGAVSQVVSREGQEKT